MGKVIPFAFCPDSGLLVWLTPHKARRLTGQGMESGSIQASLGLPPQAVAQGLQDSNSVAP